MTRVPIGTALLLAVGVTLGAPAPQAFEVASLRPSQPGDPANPASIPMVTTPTAN